ncbi:hypothetical protein LWI29_013097 [Acer saccharum]|uniref:Uncharacterized protein n=1 Tax=Acer saccharum TaxID=4024 RepID=A0AA39RGL4_ACESA|nr:hypothetical protein LWI29_013097 [Acer saccharum]
MEASCICTPTTKKNQRIEDSPADQYNTRYNVRTESGGYAEKIAYRNEDNEQVLGKNSDVLHDKAVGLVGPISQTNIDTSDRMQWIMVKDMEKNLVDRNVAMEDMETYSRAYVLEMGKDIDDQNDETWDQGSEVKKNVRRWKRVAKSLPNSL